MTNKCNLCPRRCNVNRAEGEKGFCGADDNIKVARIGLHYWEEPCISGETGSGTVFFSGCNMKCVFCQNYDISTKNKGYYISEDELAYEFLNLQNNNANNINLVTPTHYIHKIIKALDKAKAEGLNIPVVYNSGGYESVESLKTLRDYVDIYIPDMKYFSDKYSLMYSKAPEYFNIAKNAIAEMFSQVGKFKIGNDGVMKKGVIVRHLMLPGLLFDSKKIIDYLYSEYKDDIFISLMSQYTPMPNVCKVEKLNRKLSDKHYKTMVEYCEYLGIKNMFIQDLSSSEECFIPEFYGE